MAEMSEDDIGAMSAADWAIHDAPSPSDTLKSDMDMEDRNNMGLDGPSQPIQKRRRVTRACDECRRKKIKCDGKQPCTHCSVYSYECTYDKPSNRRRNPAPQYIEALEGRLHRAEAMLRKLMPDIDLNDPNLDPAIQQEFQNREQTRAQAANKIQAAPPAPQQTTDSNDKKILSMIDSIGQLDLDEKGEWDFHGSSSGTVFLKRMKENFRGMLDPVANGGPFLPRTERHPNMMLALDVSNSMGYSPFSGISTYPELPPKDVAQRLCYYALSCSTCLVRIVHIPAFYEKVERIYEIPLDHLDQEDTHFVALFFAVLALGCMYNSFDDSSDSLGYKASMEEGLKYYKTAKAILKDLTECRDVVSIQALLFMILFLQSTSNLSACYAFIGIALRSALRIGLHRNIDDDRINSVQQEVRRRVFYVIRQMDIYVSTLLGFPLLLQSHDIDQQYPTEVDDEFITNQGIIQPPLGTPSFFQAFNAHTRLMETLNKITKFVYPMKSASPSPTKGDGSSQTYLISYSRVKEIESDLHNWFEKLPEAWRPSPDGPVEVIRVRHLLRFAYAHVQLVLYRPFLHYISPRLNQTMKVDELSYACAAAAISVSRNIVHIGLEIRKQRVLSGPYWFMLYTEFFAVLSLVFYAVENPGKPGCAEVLADAHAGRQMIAELADKSMAAEMVTKTLTSLFDQLPDALDPGRARAATKKRAAMVPTKQGMMAAQHQALAQAMSPQQSEDLMRTHSSPMNNRVFGTPTSMSSLDVLSADQAFHEMTFSGNMQDLYPMEVSSRMTPESNGNITGANHHSFVSQAMGSHSLQNPVHKLDALMFPSDDPFAYPNQPMMELGFQPKGETPTGLVQDPNFFFSGTPLGDMNQQFLNTSSPFMVQPQVQNDLGLSTTMFDHTGLLGLHNQVERQPQIQQAQIQQQQQQQQRVSQPQIPQQQQAQVPPPQIQQQPQVQPSLISRQPSQHSQLQRQASQHSQQSQRQPQVQVQRPQQGTPQQQQQQQQQQVPQPPVQQSRQQQRARLGLSFFHRRVRAERQQERQQERQIEQIFTEHGMQADFGSFFGSGRGGFQGM